MSEFWGENHEEMSLKTLFKLCLNKEISDLQKLLLVWISIHQEEKTLCDNSNQELANIFDRHISNISKAISSLTRRELIVQTTADSKRFLALGEFAYPLIIKEINKNNSYLLISKDNKISIKDCEEVALYIISEGFLKYDYKEMCKELLQFAQSQNSFRKVKSFPQLKAVVYAALKKLEKIKLLKTDFDSIYDDALSNLANTIKEICGLEEQDKKERIDEAEVRREKNAKILNRHISKGYQERLLDLTISPHKLQQPFKGQKLISITGIAKSTYEGGNPLYCNIVLEVNNCTVYASVKSKHYPDLKNDIDNHIGLIKINGQVSYSKYHNEQFDTKNIIRSIDLLAPIEFINDSNFINLKLND